MAANKEMKKKLESEAGEDSPLKYFGRKNSNWSIKDANDDLEDDVL